MATITKWKKSHQKRRTIAKKIELAKVNGVTVGRSFLSGRGERIDVTLRTERDQSEQYDFCTIELTMQEAKDLFEKLKSVI